MIDGGAILELNKIYCGDNCDLLGQLPRECIDLVVTSPPYDSLRTYGGHSWDFFGVAWQLKRVLKPGGVIVWVVADATKDGSETGTSMEQALHFKRLGLNLHDTMIWNKNSFTAVGSLQCRYASVFEYMFIFSKGKPKTFNPICDKPNVCSGQSRNITLRQRDGSMKRKKKTHVFPSHGQRFNIWNCAPCLQRTGHPAPFPVSLVNDHIISWSNEGDVVLDPFMGSGQTGIAAKELGRRFLGFEINEQYCAIAERRMAQQVLELAD